MEGEIITTQEIFSFSQERIVIAQGVVPTFTEEIIATGLPVDLSIFRKNTD